MIGVVPVMAVTQFWFDTNFLVESNPAHEVPVAVSNVALDEDSNVPGTLKVNGKDRVKTAPPLFAIIWLVVPVIEVTQ